MPTSSQKQQTSQKSSSAESQKVGQPQVGHEANSLLQLQRTIGNRAVRQLLQGQLDGLETRDATASGRPGNDVNERPQSNDVQITGAGGSAAQSSDPQLGRGQPLDSTTRTFFERRFGQNLADVRLHTDSKARESASQVKARAYTVGEDIVFGEGMYRPETKGGQRLLTHELAHVIQQR